MIIQPTSLEDPKLSKLKEVRYINFLGWCGIVAESYQKHLLIDYFLVQTHLRQCEHHFLRVSEYLGFLCYFVVGFGRMDQQNPES